MAIINRNTWNDYSEFMEQVEKYSKCYVVSHHQPDFDAMGSQLGLALALQGTYPDKDIYASGECGYSEFESYYTSTVPSDYEGALVIVTDAGASHLVSDPHYVKADYIIVIDHHESREAFGDLSYVDSGQISACLIVYDIIRTRGLYINQVIARLLLSGIISDSGRFRYKNTDADTLRVSGELLDMGVDLQQVYDMMSVQSLAYVRYKGYVMQRFNIYEEHIGYMIHRKQDVNESGLSLFEVSRGMVNAMADIEGIDMWVNFTESDKGILTEIRSAKKSVVHVAKSFRGGGHALACGATLVSMDKIEECLQKLHAI